MNSKNQADAILRFLSGLKPDFELPKGIQLMQPMKEQVTWTLIKKFYRKFYDDRRPRALVFGINPGRFGGGITGIPFTDPVKLETECGILNNLKKNRELSADFVYEVIRAMDGPAAFYGRFFITAVCPLGFMASGKNLNYYDQRELRNRVEPFIIRSISEQLNKMNVSNSCFCLGEGSNYNYLKKLNESHHFFSEIIALPHPRWIMQYRRKSIVEYVNLYCSKLGKFRN